MTSAAIIVLPVPVGSTIIVLSFSHSRAKADWYSRRVFSGVDTEGKLHVEGAPSSDPGPGGLGERSAVPAARDMSTCARNAA